MRREFFTSLAWWTLRPDDSLLAEQPGRDDPARYISASRSESGDLAVIYLPAGGRVKLKGGALKDGLRAEWIGPRTGQRTEIQGSLISQLVAPDHQDWVPLLNEN
jgi:hypothetical protein